MSALNSSKPRLEVKMPVVVEVASQSLHTLLLQRSWDGSVGGVRDDRGVVHKIHT